MNWIYFVKGFFEEIHPLFVFIAVGVFLYGLAKSPVLAIAMGATLFAFVILVRGRWLLRLFILMWLVAATHDALTGQLYPHVVSRARF
jgi:hypothetical protein